MNALVLAALLLVSNPTGAPSGVPSCAASASVAGSSAGEAVSSEVIRRYATWPGLLGPFSWADRVMNSTTIARRGGIYALRAKILAICLPAFDVRLRFGPFSSVTPGFEGESPTFSADFDGDSSVGQLSATPSLSATPDLGFFSYALGSKLYEDAAALLFTPGVFAPSDTLQYLRGVTAYDIHDFSLAADCFAAIPEGSPYAVKAKSFLDVWNSTPEIPNYKPKSPLLAGAMSAVIPGSGKIYAGDIYSGVSTLLIVGALGGMAAESWIKLGGRDWRTIALSSVFGLFYIGNIYGSALSVSVIRNTYQNAEKATLLFDLRIPLHQF